MADTKSSRGMIAVDKMGTKVLFLNPVTYETEVVLEDFPRTVHELLVVPEANLAYVPIFGDGIHGRNPNPGHLLCIISDVNTDTRRISLSLKNTLPDPWEGVAEKYPIGTEIQG